MEMLGKIRRMHLPDKLSLHEVARRTGARHLDYLDGWRGLAILFLLIGHFFPLPGINLGRVGVNLFFVLSGLLMAQLLFVRGTPLKLFYKRRISRIFPALYIYLTIVICVMAITGMIVNWREMAAATLLVNNYFQGDSDRAAMPFGHIWSLSVEEHAYILLSLIALAARRRWCNPLWAIIFFVGVSAVTSIVYWRLFNLGELEFGLWYHTEIAAYGIFVSAFFMLALQKWKIPKLPFLVYPLMGILALGLHWWSIPLPLSMIFGVGILALLVNLLHEAPPLIKAILSFLPLRKFGIWSFSLYVWQQPFYLAHYRDGMSSGHAISLAFCAGVTSYYLLENPIRRYLNSRWAAAAAIEVVRLDEVGALPISATPHL
ncbi:MAG: Acyltransferase [Herbaspirillum sp.]|nr:Acyltransferase [Herbaspirillum sp.]